MQERPVSEYQMAQVAMKLNLSIILQFCQLTQLKNIQISKMLITLCSNIYPHHHYESCRCMETCEDIASFSSISSYQVPYRKPLLF